MHHVAHETCPAEARTLRNRRFPAFRETLYTALI
jgi:hypothetical protein